MRRIIGLVSMGLAGFLIVTCVLAILYIPGQVQKTPLDTDSYTRLAGNAAVLPSGGGAPVRAVSHTVANGKASDGDVVVFDTFTCLVTDEGGSAPDCSDDDTLVTATTDRFATDRHTAVAVNDEKYIGDAEPHEGLVNKFPFNVEKKTYPFWDGVVGRSVPAEFKGEEKVNGWNTYKFVIDVKDEPAEISDGIQGTYSSLKTMYIDPRTGSIIKQTEQQLRALDDGTPVLELDFGFTDKTVAANIKDAKDNDSSLGAVEKLPWITGIAGLLALIAGLVLFLGGRRDTATHAPESAYESTSLDIFDDGERRSRRD
ncbi:MAG: DUF3068 domain-containing protein [Janibacter sp.]|nr:DUF3068 domain-containing protein [Janibacter sp.]